MVSIGFYQPINKAQTNNHNGAEKIPRNLTKTQHAFFLCHEKYAAQKKKINCRKDIILSCQLNIIRTWKYKTGHHNIIIDNVPEDT